MTIYKTANDSMRVGALERNGKYVIIVEKKFNRIVATKHSKKAHAEVDYSHFEKEFDTAEQANNYFKGIKKNNPTLARA